MLFWDISQRLSYAPMHESFGKRDGEDLNLVKPVVDFWYKVRTYLPLLLTTKFMKIVHLLKIDSRIFLKTLRDLFSQFRLSLNF
tara:strand:+ start:224 stop:475 length:252 start_codon:yes stop_codon:yes gene_type:complete